MKDANNEADPNREVTITYTNHRGEIGDRRITPTGKMFYGKTEYHPVDQWFMVAYCHTKQAEREFAVKDIAMWDPTVPT